MTDRQDMEAVIESILFVAHDPISRTRLIEVFGEREREQATEALEAVIERFREQPEKGVMIDEVAGGLRLVTRPDLHGYLKRFFEVSSANKLTMPALETLSIIAYRQPITAPEIAEFRSVSATGVIKKLLERRLIRIAGRKEVVGKPFLYATTREFLMHFGLKSLKELPPLEQFEELFGDELEAAPEDIEPDAEEIVDREAAEIAEAEDDAEDEREAEAIEQQRAAQEDSEEKPEQETLEEKEPEQETPEVEAPEEETPEEETPEEETPEEETPEEETPEEETPEVEALEEETPDEESDMSDLSDRSDESDNAPAEEPPAEEPPAEEPPAEQTPTDEVAEEVKA